MTPRLALSLAAAVLALAAGLLLQRRVALRTELAALRTAIAQADSGATDAALAAEVDRVRVALEGARGKPAKGADAHLALVIGDGLLTLERGDIVFRSALVSADVPRGVHVIDSVEARRVVFSGGLSMRAATADRLAAPEPGTIRVPRADFDAIRPNLKPGLAAYFF